jgi:hypothetical protein
MIYIKASAACTTVNIKLNTLQSYIIDQQI